MLREGDLAPLFKLPDADMEEFDLASERNQHHVVLYFYLRDRTPGCTQMAADFSDHESDFLRRDCIVVGVSPDDCLTHADFRDDEGLSVRLLSDADNVVSRLYHVWHEREVGGQRRNAIRRSTFIIDKQGVIRHALFDVTPRGHAHAVLQLIRNLEPEPCKPRKKLSKMPL